ncbi:MAG: HigA family addiction module antitoxin [Victivallales bacterium]
MNISNQYSPDYSVHPGAILEETLEARGLSKKEAADRCGISAKHLNQILHEKAAIVPDVAISLEKVLGIAANIWTNIQSNYELGRARIQSLKTSSEAYEWARRFPVNEMSKRSWILIPANKAQTANSLLQFFGVSNTDAWEKWFGELRVSYRSSPSFKRAPEAVSAWLRQGEILSQNIPASSFDEAKFKSALEEIRTFTVKSPETFEPEMKKKCADAGVALVFLGELPKTHLSGATRWMSKDKALIMLSLRHKTNDHFWFSFFHEAGHILLHGKKMLFLDDIKHSNADAEKEADRFAANVLIPEKEYRSFSENMGRADENSVTQLARKSGIAPGIVVGRLQHDKVIEYSEMNTLKEKFCLVENHANI